jgi:hypothetical protein
MRIDNLFYYLSDALPRTPPAPTVQIPFFETVHVPWSVFVKPVSRSRAFACFMVGVSILVVCLSHIPLTAQAIAGVSVQQAPGKDHTKDHLFIPYSNPCTSKQQKRSP